MDISHGHLEVRVTQHHLQVCHRDTLIRRAGGKSMAERMKAADDFNAGLCFHSPKDTLYLEVGLRAVFREQQITSSIRRCLFIFQ